MSQAAPDGAACVMSRKESGFQIRKPLPHVKGLFDCLKFLVQFLQMGLQVCGLGEGSQLAKGQAADKLHLRIFRCALAELVQNGRCRRILQNVLYFAVERKCYERNLLFL